MTTTSDTYRFATSMIGPCLLGLLIAAFVAFGFGFGLGLGRPRPRPVPTDAGVDAAPD